MASQPCLGDTGLLHGTRTRSYGSLIQSNYSTAQIRKIQHLVQPGDTLQGLSLKYGVTMEQIKRANRLYTNDSIFLKKYLNIPVLADQSESTNKLNSQEDVEGSAENQSEKGEKEKIRHRTVPKDEMSVIDYMTRMDTRIRVSKRAAVKKIRDGGSFATEDEETPGTGSGYQEPNPNRSAHQSPQTQQRSLLGPVPLTITTRASTIRDHEDEIFKL